MGQSTDQSCLRSMAGWLVVTIKIKFVWLLRAGGSNVTRKGVETETGKNNI